jgi:hypothetical protein
VCACVCVWFALCSLLPPPPALDLQLSLSIRTLFMMYSLMHRDTFSPEIVRMRVVRGVYVLYWLRCKVRVAVGWGFAGSEITTHTHTQREWLSLSVTRMPHDTTKRLTYVFMYVCVPLNLHQPRIGTRL